MKYSIGRILVITVMMLPLMWSCGGSGEQNDNQGKDTVVVNADSLNANTGEAFRIPPPVDLFIFMRDQGVAFQTDLVNPVDNAAKYNTQVSKAVNFGVYAADLAYCAFNENNQKTADYYVTTKGLADDLGISKGFNQEVTDRIDKNINNSDSLYAITKEAYWTAYDQVEANDELKILPFINIGSWMESLYIAVNSVQKFDAKSEVLAMIIDQKLILETLLDYLDNIQQSENLKTYSAKLIELNGTWEPIMKNEDVLVTEEQFIALKTKVNEIRQQIIL
ncbi:MAG: hypothetical protein KKD31_13380 [Bacteroidetes bacterium]|nr:hypothetical protein [Bacteroidota bacterium]